MQPFNLDQDEMGRWCITMTTGRAEDFDEQEYAIAYPDSEEEGQALVDHLNRISVPLDER